MRRSWARGGPGGGRRRRAGGGSCEETLHAADVCFTTGDYKGVIVLYERALVMDPSDICLEGRIGGLEDKLAKGQF